VIGQRRCVGASPCSTHRGEPGGYIVLVPHPRPIVRDNLTGRGSAVVATRVVQGDEAAPGRTPVTHSYAALAFYTGGRSRVEQNGAWNLREGDVLLVPAGEPHRMLDQRRPERWGLAFCVPCFAADGIASLLEPFERVRDGASPVVQISSARHAYLAELFRELEDVGREPPGHALDAVQRSLLTLILAEIDRASSSARRGPGGVVAEALRFIERSCLGPLTLNDVAAAVRRSPTYVTTALTQATGRSAVQWIVSGRMAEARRLLLHSDERIEVVAERVGYADATHFIRMFRREHGATPAAWRAAQARDPRAR
jgi:AraC family transcriptional regulator, transcriptional activator of pobA